MRPNNRYVVWVSYIILILYTVPYKWPNFEKFFFCLTDFLGLYFHPSKEFLVIFPKSFFFIHTVSHTAHINIFQWMCFVVRKKLNEKRKKKMRSYIRRMFSAAQRTNPHTFSILEFLSQIIFYSTTRELPACYCFDRKFK